MIMDKLTEFANAVALNTGGAATYNVGDIVDTSAIQRDLGMGQPIWLVVQVTTAVDSAADNTTQQFRLVSDATTTIATDGSASQHLVSPVFAQATLVAGFTWAVALPIEGVAYERYLAVQHTTAVAAATAGAIRAFLSLEPPSTRKTYNDAQN
jgi:hypothetical protein